MFILLAIVLLGVEYGHCFVVPMQSSSVSLQPQNNVVMTQPQGMMVQQPQPAMMQQPQQTSMMQPQPMMTYSNNINKGFTQNHPIPQFQYGMPSFQHNSFPGQYPSSLLNVHSWSQQPMSGWGNQNNNQMQQTRRNNNGLFSDPMNMMFLGNDAYWDLQGMKMFGPMSVMFDIPQEMVWANSIMGGGQNSRSARNSQQQPRNNNLMQSLSLMHILN